MRTAAAIVITAVGLIGGSPAAAAPLFDSPAVLPEPASPTLIESAQDEGVLSLERATLYRVYAVTGDERLPGAYDSSTPVDGTFLLRQAREDLPRMEAGPARRQVAGALRAPPKTPTRPSATCCRPHRCWTPSRPSTSTSSTTKRRWRHR